MSADATEDAIIELTIFLKQIRANSHPIVFDKLWEANIMRLEEGEQINGESPDYEAEAWGVARQQGEQDIRPSIDQTSLLSGAGTVRAGANLSNEPFASQGPPLRPYFPVPTLLPPLLPETMMVYISTTPIRNAAYQQRTYAWIDAPVKRDDIASFFRGIDLRVDGLGEDDVRGWTLSYGWDDMCRWIENGDKKDSGWELFQRDLRRASASRVMVWRMKVFVVGK
jgi:hypothetical protein